MIKITKYVIAVKRRALDALNVSGGIVMKVQRKFVAIAIFSDYTQRVRRENLLREIMQVGVYYIVMYRRALVGVANALPFGLSSAMTDRVYWQLRNRWRT